MERLLHYVWQHRLYPYGSLKTVEGVEVEVITPGLHNDNAGPDFIDAKLKLNGELWAGNVEVHTRSSDWYHHHHEENAAYDNVILHVVEVCDRSVATSKGREVPQLVLAVPDYVEQHYNELLREERFPLCYQYATSVPSFLIRSWLDRLAAERLETKTHQIEDRANRVGGDWETALFVTLARSFGFGINGDAFEDWAFRIPLQAAAKHRDDAFQIEALFLGQAGLLQDDMLQDYHRDEAMQEGYFNQLKSEYHFLANKFSLKPMNGNQWKFLRMRPQNFPHIRIVQLAQLYVQGNVSISKVIETQTLDDARRLFQVGVSPYWRTHYAFGAVSASSLKTLREESVSSLLINTFIPALYAYGFHRFHTEYCDRALQFLSGIKAENNYIIRIWKDVGLNVESASDSQALIQLRKQYCERKDCLRCRLGLEYLKETHVYHVLQEPEK